MTDLTRDQRRALETAIKAAREEADGLRAQVTSAPEWRAGPTVPVVARSPWFAGQP